jgi:hypothetical protein
MDGEEQVFICGRVARRGVPMMRAENIWSYGGTCVLRVVATSTTRGNKNIFGIRSGGKNDLRSMISYRKA